MSLLLEPGINDSFNQQRMLKVTLCQSPSLVFKKLSVFASCLLGFSLLEPSHQGVRKPEQPMEKPTWRGAQPNSQSWLSSQRQPVLTC